MIRTASLFVLLAFAAGAFPQQPASLEARRKQLSDLLAEQWEYTMRTNPEYASILGDKRYNDKLSDVSEKAVYADLEEQKKFLARFKAIDTSGFSKQEALNKTLMVRQLEIKLEGARFKDWEQPVTQFGGIHIDAPQLVSVLSFETVKDYDDFIARLNQLPVSLDQTMDLMRKGMADHIIPPKILLEQVAKQAGAIAGNKPEDSPFMEPAKKLPAGFSDADQTRLQQQMLEAVRDRVTPAYAKFTKFVAEEYAPHGRSEPGLWALPDGNARYAFAIKQTTTTNLTPEQIHEIGLREVAKDRAAMLKIAEKLGYKDLKSFDAALDKNPTLHPKSRQEMLDLYRKYTDQMWARLPQMFGRLPKAKVEILPVEAYREKEASGASYIDGTPDGKRPGHIMVNTGDFEKRTTTNIETTAYHEGVPGHHRQLCIAHGRHLHAPFRHHPFAYSD